MGGDDATTGVAQATEESAPHPFSADPGFRNGIGMVGLETAGAGPDGAGATEAGAAGAGGGPHRGHVARVARRDRRSPKRLAGNAARGRRAEGRGAADRARSHDYGLSGGSAALLSDTL